MLKLLNYTITKFYLKLMIEIKAPNPILQLDDHQTIFLAGSIEMGVAENWQDRVKNLLKDKKVILLNPRRDDWDSTWIQSKDNPEFVKQVMWELNAQELADKIIMYFDPNTKSPISLLELGLFARTGKMIVICPNGFYRKGNVDIVCEKYNVRQIQTLEDVVNCI